MTSVSIPTTDPQRPTLIASADSELMQNHQPALPVSPNDELAAVYDSNGLPIVLSFSPAGDFYVVLNAPGTPTGWQQIDLSSTLTAYGTTKSFAVGQLPNGNIVVAVAVQDIQDATTQNLFIAGPLSNDPAQTQWASFGQYWTRSQNKVPGSAIDRILVGSDDDGQDNGIPRIAVSLATSNPSVATEYVLQSSIAGGTLTWEWLDFPTPTSMVTVKDYALGSIADLGHGVYILYEGAGGQDWLIFKTFLDSFGRDYDRELTLPAGAAALQVTPAVNGTTGLFVGGTAGVSWFSETNQEKDATSVAIAPPSSVPDIQPGGLIARNDQTQSGTTAVWALSGSNLYYFHSQAGGSWSTPLLLRQGVTRIAPLRNQQKFANELIYLGVDLDTNPNIYYMWQDPSTMLWKEDHIPVYATDKILELSTYTTHLTFSDGASTTFGDVTFNVTADAWLRVVINGTTQILDPDVPVAVQPDVQGVITILNSVNDLSAPLIHLTSTLFSGTIDVDPAHKVSGILNQVRGDGDVPVLPHTLPSGVGPGDVSSAIKGMMQFHPSAGAEPAQAIVYRAAGAAPAPRLNTAAVASGKTFGVSFEAGGFKYHDAAAVAMHPGMTASLSVGSTLSNIGGDVLEFLKNVADKVKHFVVTAANGVVKFVATIGDDVANFVITTAEEVYKAISWVFDKLKVAFQDLIKWLGFLFDWDDILATQKVLVNLVNQAFAFGQAELVSLEDKVTNFFDGLEQKVKALEPLGGQYGGTNVRSKGSGAASGLSSVAQKALDFGQGSGGNYARYHMLHSGPLSFAGDVATTMSQPLMDFFNDVAIPTLQSVQDSAQQIFQDIHDAIKGSTLTLDQVIQRIAGDVVIAILDAVKTVIVGILKLIGDLVTMVQTGLNANIHIPFITALYEKFVGSELSLLNCVMLLFAIPSTAVCKIVAGTTPFSPDDHLDTRDYRDLLDQVGISSASPAPQGPAAAKAPALARMAVAAPQAAPASRGPMKAAEDDASSGTSGGKSNQASSCAKGYANGGALVAVFTTGVYDVLNLLSAFKVLDAADKTADEIEAAVKFVSNVSLIQIVPALATFALTVPVLSGPERDTQFGSWAVSGADIVKSAVAPVWIKCKGDSDTLQNVLGVYEIAEGIVQLVLSIVIVVEQGKDTENNQMGIDDLACISNVFASVGTSANGITRMTKGVPQGIAGGVAGVTYLIAGIIDFCTVFVAFESGQVAG